LPVHVKVDTGMGRLGVAPEQALELLQTTQGLPGLTLEGFYTHYSSAEDDVAFTRHQASCFRRLLKRATSVGVRIPLVHAENTAALLHGTGTTFQLVRPGVLVYGVIPSGWRVEARALQSFVRPALAWKCRVSFIKWIPQGTSLSYGNTFVAARPLQVATLTAGYGDGYLRAGSNRARVLVGGRRCRVLGRITMDQMLVDVTRVPNVAPGDEAVLLGRQGEEEITASDLAQWNRTIPWEVLTSITYRVPRIYRGSHAA
jgi:alanine racemase